MLSLHNMESWMVRFQTAFLPLTEYTHSDLSSSEVMHAVDVRRVVMIGHHEAEDMHAMFHRTIVWNSRCSNLPTLHHPCPTTSPCSQFQLPNLQPSTTVKRPAMASSRPRKNRRCIASLNPSQTRLWIIPQQLGLRCQQAPLLYRQSETDTVTDV